MFHSDGFDFLLVFNVSLSLSLSLQGTERDKPETHSRLSRADPQGEVCTFVTAASITPSVRLWSLSCQLEEAQTRRQEKLVLRQREVLQHIDEELPLVSRSRLASHVVNAARWRRS